MKYDLIAMNCKRGSVFVYLGRAPCGASARPKAGSSDSRGALVSLLRNCALTPLCFFGTAKSCFRTSDHGCTSSLGGAINFL